MNRQTITLIGAVAAAAAIAVGGATLAYEAGKDDAETRYEVRVDAEPAVQDLADALDDVARYVDDKDIRVVASDDGDTASLTITILISKSYLVANSQSRSSWPGTPISAPVP